MLVATNCPNSYMKTKIYTLVVILFLSVLTLNAQRGFAGFSGGYGIAISRSILGYNSDDNDVSNTFYVENVRGSYGKGAILNLYGGFMVTDVIGLELAANYLIGSPYTFTTLNTNNGNVSSSEVHEISSSSFRLIPTVRLVYGEDKVHFYSRVALTFGLANKLTDKSQYTITNPAGTTIVNSVFVTSGGIYSGFSGGFGLSYDVSDHVAVYGELTRYFISWGATEGRYEEYTTNGRDDLGSMSTSNREFIYVDRVDQTMNQNSGEPTQRLKFSTPLNALSVNLGLHFTF